MDGARKVGGAVVELTLVAGRGGVGDLEGLRSGHVCSSRQNRSSRIVRLNVEMLAREKLTKSMEFRRSMASREKVYL